MDYIITCTSEELALMVTLCGYSDVAKSIAEASIGEKSPAQWDAIMEVTVHQLILKGLWDSEKDQRNEIPLREEVQQFIQRYVESNRMIRCSYRSQSTVLMLHHIEEETWISHVIDRDIIHEFAFIERDEIPNLIKDYYSFSLVPQEEETLKFQLTDEAFDLLSKKENVGKVRRMSDLSTEEEQSFQRFLEDLERDHWSLYNISLFQIPSIQADPILEDIVFFLPSPAGVWVAEYTDNELTPVTIGLNNGEQWCELLTRIGNTAAGVTLR
jgi:hypothetical protein